MLRRHTQRLRKIPSAETQGQIQDEGQGQIHKTAFRQPQIQTQQQIESRDGRHRDREVENSNLASFMVKGHQCEVL